MNGRLWSPEEIDLVMACYEWTPTAELAAMMGRTCAMVYNLATKFDLHKAPELVAAMSREKIADPNHRGRLFQFPKGHMPQNKGKKMPPGWSPGRMGETQFKKGTRSGRAAALWMLIGATRKIDGYLYRKVSDIPNVPYTENWKLEHWLVWERRRGPVPPGHVLVFRDGNPDNLKLRNLELITRAELMRRNTIHNLPKPLVEVIMLNGALKRKLRNKLRKQARDGEEQDVRSA